MEQETKDSIENFIISLELPYKGHTKFILKEYPNRHLPPGLQLSAPPHKRLSEDSTSAYHVVVGETSVTFWRHDYPLPYTQPRLLERHDYESKDKLKDILITMYTAPTTCWT